MSASELVGRDEDMCLLRGMIDVVRERGGAVLIRGDPGIGKSALLHDAAQYGRSAGLHVLRTTGYEAESQLPFAGLHQLLRPLLDGQARLPAAQRLALSVALGAVDGAAPQPFMLALAAFNLITEAAAQRPVFIAVDDMQWLDSPTQELLAFVARRVDIDPVLIVGAVRNGYDGPFLNTEASFLDLAGLDDQAARQLLARLASDLPRTARERVRLEAQGNPLALVELPIAWRDTAGQEPLTRQLPLTSRLERAFGGRIATLPRKTRDVLLVAAVDTGAGLAETLAAASVLAGEPVTMDVLTPAVEAELVQVRELRVEFRHPLTRSGVLTAEPVGRWHAANAALATVIDEPYRRALHRAQSVIGPDDEIADELDAMHTVLLGRGAVTLAIWVLERSAQLTTDSATRGFRLLRAAEHAFGVGRVDMVDHLVTSAGQCALSALSRAKLEWLREIFHDGIPGDARRIDELCAIALVAERAGDRDLALNLVHGAALRTWWSDAGPAAQDRVVATAESLAAGRADPRQLAAIAMAHPTREAATVLDALSGAAFDDVNDPAALVVLAQAAHAVGDPVRTVDLVDRCEPRLRAHGQLALLSQVLTMQVFDQLELGDWDRAAAAVTEARTLNRDTGQPIWDTGSLTLAAIIAGLRGDNAQARTMAAQAALTTGRKRLNDLHACVQLATGISWLVSGRYGDAFAALRTLFDRGGPAFHESERYHGVAFLAETARRAGHIEEARRIVAGLSEQARISPAPTLLVHLDYAHAVLAADDQAEQLFTTGLSGNLERWPWHRARLQLAYGSWLRRQRRPVDARGPLRAAHASLESIGASIWATQAAAELRAAGEQPKTSAPAPHTALSAQELQIARLAATGLTNAEIAQQLYLSPRTVGSHLYRIFPKLGISSRGQLAARLADVAPPQGGHS
jgi:DNA-binding CsgD family transcriptional regulator